MNISKPELQFLSPEWIADVRQRCADFLENPRGKRWGDKTAMLQMDAVNIPKLLDEIEKLRHHVARLSEELEHA